MIDRRSFMLAGTALALSVGRARAQAQRTTLSGGLAQGCLTVGKTDPGAKVRLDGKALHVSPGGDFVFGIAYNQTMQMRLDVTFTDGTKEQHVVAPVLRDYEIQRIDGLPQEQVTPPPDILARIIRENGILHEVRTHDTDGVGFSEPFDWPVPGIITSLYGAQRILNGTPAAPHLGVDVAAPTGTPIHAPADATVILADDYYLDGGFTVLDHGHGVNTNYVHQSKRFVKVGDKIARGFVIGLIGQTGRATGPNLHWGLNWFQVGLDPSRWAKTPLPEKS